MIKSLLFVLLVVALVSGQEPCNTLSCSDEFAKCTADYYVAPFSGPFTNTNENNLIYCNSGFYCNFENDVENQGYGVCSKVGEEGDICPPVNACTGSGCDTNTKNTGCSIGLSCYGNGNGPATCQYLSYLTLGEDCESDLQCVDGLRCDTIDTETCVININQTVVETIICDNTNQCKANEYCDQTGDSNVCSPVKADGQSCDSTDECLPTSVCDDAVCTKVFSKSVDADCTSELVCDISQNLVCAGGVCTAVPAAPTGDCNNSTDVICGANNLCLCSGNQGSCLSTGFASPAQCKSSMTTLLQCISDNGCQNLFLGSGLNPVAPDSCAYKNCGENYCNVVSNCQASNIGKCNSEVLVASICTSGSSMIQASIAMIVLALFALLF